MRYAMSVLSRWRTKWGKGHFTILVKVLEHGYETRRMGLRYGGNIDENKVNVIEGYAIGFLSVSPAVSRLSLCDDEWGCNFTYLKTSYDNG